MKNIIKLFLIYLLCLIIYNCAYMGSPGGGPADETPPYLILDQLSPQSNLNIGLKESIILPFSERLFPTYVNNSIRIEPEIEIKIKNLSDKIIISPKDNWPSQFILYASRTISDYSRNKLENPIQLIFSTTDSIVGDTIKGELFNYNPDNNYEVALIDSNYNIISKTESGHHGSFQFLGQQNYSSYFILALENKIQDDFNNQIRRNNYGLSNQEINTSMHKIFISPPIPRRDIMNISLVNRKYGKISLSSGSKIDIYFNDEYYRNKGIIQLYEQKINIGNLSTTLAPRYIFRDYNFIDSLNLELTLSNQLEEYNVKHSFEPFNEFEDITPPTITDNIKRQCYNDSTFTISLVFSEPIVIDSSVFKIQNILDSTFTNINQESNNSKPKKDKKNDIFLPGVTDYLQTNENRILIRNIVNSSNNKLLLDCKKIRDLNNNNLCDSLLVISNNQECSEIIQRVYGELNGNISYQGPNNLHVIAYKIADDIERYVIKLDDSNVSPIRIYYSSIDENNNFKLKLQPGEYRIIAYEDINSVTRSYFSGTLEPFKKAAKFTVYNDIIRIRANWTNTIKMKLE